MGKCASKDRLGHSRVRKITAARRSSDTATIDQGSEKQPFFEKDKDTPEVLSARSSTSDREDGNETYETSVQRIVVKDEIFRSTISSTSYSNTPPDAEDDHLPDFPVLDPQGNPPDEKVGQRETRPSASNETIYDVNYIEVAGSTERDRTVSPGIIDESHKERFHPLEASSREDNGSIQAERVDHLKQTSEAVEMIPNMELIINPDATRQARGGEIPTELRPEVVLQECEDEAEVVVHAKEVLTQMQYITVPQKVTDTGTNITNIPEHVADRSIGPLIDMEGSAQVHKSVVQQTIPFTTETSFEQDFQVQTDQETSAEVETSIGDTEIKEALDNSVEILPGPLDSDHSAKDKIEISPQLHDAEIETQQMKCKEPEAAVEAHREEERELDITAPQTATMEEPLINEYAVSIMKATGQGEEPSITEQRSIVSTNPEMDKIPVNGDDTKTEVLQEDFPVSAQISQQENVEVGVHDIEVSMPLTDNVKQTKLEITEKFSISAAFKETENTFVGETAPPGNQTQPEVEALSAHLEEQEIQSSEQDKEVEERDQTSLELQEILTAPPQAAEVVDIEAAKQQEETSAAKTAEDVTGLKDMDVEERDQTSLDLQETLKEPPQAAEVVNIEAVKQQEETSAEKIVEEDIAGIDGKLTTDTATQLKMDENSDQTTDTLEGEEANTPTMKLVDHLAHVESQLAHDPQSISERNVVEMESAAPDSEPPPDAPTGGLERTLDVKDAEEASKLTTAINSKDKEAEPQLETRDTDDETEVPGKGTEESDRSTGEKEPIDGGLHDIPKDDMPTEQEELEDLESNLSTVVEPDLDRDTETALEEVGGFYSEDPTVSTAILESGEAETQSEIGIDSETLKEIEDDAKFAGVGDDGIECKEPYTDDTLGFASTRELANVTLEPSSEDPQSRQVEAEEQTHKLKAESPAHNTMDSSSEFTPEIAKPGEGNKIIDHEEMPSDTVEQTEHQHGTEESLPKSADIEEESSTELQESTEEEKGDEPNECHGTIGTIVEEPVSIPIEQEPEAAMKDAANDNIKESTKRKMEMDVTAEMEPPELPLQSDREQLQLGNSPHSVVEEPEAMGFIEKVAGEAGPEIQNITAPEMQGVQAEDFKSDAEEKLKLVLQKEADVASETTLLQSEERNDSELAQADNERMDLNIGQESTAESIGIKPSSTKEDTIYDIIEGTQETFKKLEPDDSAQNSIPVQAEYGKLSDDAEPHLKLQDKLQPSSSSDTTEEIFTVQQASAESQQHAEMDINAPSEPQESISEHIALLTPSELELKGAGIAQNLSSTDSVKDLGIQEATNIHQGVEQDTDVLPVLEEGQENSALQQVSEIQDIAEQERDDTADVHEAAPELITSKGTPIEDLQQLEETLQSIDYSEHIFTLPQAPEHGGYFNLQASESQNIATQETDDPPLIQVGAREETTCFEQQESSNSQDFISNLQECFEAQQQNPEGEEKSNLQPTSDSQDSSRWETAPQETKEAEDVCSKYSSEEGFSGQESQKDFELQQASENQESMDQDTQAPPQAQTLTSEGTDPELGLKVDTQPQDVSSKESIQESFKTQQAPESTENLLLQQSTETQETVAQEISITPEVQEGMPEKVSTENQLESDLQGQPQTEDASYKYNLEEGFNMAPNSQADDTEQEEKPPAELQEELSQGNEISNDDLKESITSQHVSESQEDWQNGLDIKVTTEQMTEAPLPEEQEGTLEGAASEEEPISSVRSEDNLENQFNIQQETETLQGATQDTTSMLVVDESESLTDETQQTHDGHDQQSSGNLISKEVLEKDLDIKEASEMQEGVEQDTEALQGLQESAVDLEQKERNMEKHEAAQDEDENLASEEKLEILEASDTQKGDEQETDVSKGIADNAESNLEVLDQAQKDQEGAAKETCELPEFQAVDSLIVTDADRVQPELDLQETLIPQDVNTNENFEVPKVQQASVTCEGVEQEVEALQESLKESMIQTKDKGNANKEQSSLQIQSGEEKCNLSTSESNIGTADTEQELTGVADLDRIYDGIMETGMGSPKKEHEFTKGGNLLGAKPQEIPLEKTETNEEDQQN